MMKFVTDHMLGRLARYLRLLGYDTFYPEKPLDDDSIIDIARSQERVLLSRDRVLCSRYSNSLLIKSENYLEQLKEVIDRFNLDGKMMLSRCSVCNTPLEKIEKERIKGRVPENVFLNHEEFYVCPGCGRIYWMGSHTKRIIETLEEVLGFEGRGD
jgi:uncharacterized protein with PIN domain